MFYHHNDYLIPVIAGGGRQAFETAKRIKKQRTQTAHIFAERFGFSQMLAYKCHKIYSEKDIWLVKSLLDFAKLLEEPYCVAFIIYDEKSRGLAEKYACELETSYLIIEESDYLSKE